MSDGYTFKLCSTAAELREAYRLRLEVFHLEQQFPEETEIDQ
jgi:predicted GNAT family N-acyltransferase